MILYLQATTNVQDLIIDYIEVKLKSGKTVSLNWDESGINRSETGFDARYKGVYFDEEYLGFLLPIATMLRSYAIWSFFILPERG